MKQPQYLLENGTKVRTNKVLDDTRGMMIAPKHLEQRKADTSGVVTGIVPGHGGDVYWVSHPGDPLPAAYCFTEFELEP